MILPIVVILIGIGLMVILIIVLICQKISSDQGKDIEAVIIVEQPPVREIKYSQRNEELVKNTIGSECIEDKDCPSSRGRCLNSICMSCINNTDCKDYEFCDNTGLCREACNIDSDCFNQLCHPSKNYCVNCVTSLDCMNLSDTGDTCNELEGICKMCQSSDQCPGSAKCYNGKCHNQKCRNSLECEDMEACLESTNIDTNDEKVCILVGSKCQNVMSGNQKCPEGLKCMVSKNNIQQIETEDSYRCLQCNSKYPCPSGQYCKRGVCYKYCKGSDDCLLNEYGSSNINNMKCIGMRNNKVCCPNVEPYGKQCSDRLDCPLNNDISILSEWSSDEYPEEVNEYGFCINGLCTCRAGEIYDVCKNQDDCRSSECQYNPEYDVRMCNYPNAECWFDYDPIYPERDFACHSYFPHCLRGLCKS